MVWRMDSETKKQSHILDKVFLRSILRALIAFILDAKHDSWRLLVGGDIGEYTII